MVCSNSSKPLKMLKESAGQQKRYLLEGIFAELDVKNRNQRIYTKEEYLKHLDYLREDIRTGQSLLGELDHPEDRFEVKLKEASHRILDIWYDRQSNCVLGKIELLNTPNGLLAQSLLEQGIPLHISSRAAGTVNSDNTVNIQQIYTYDLVCKPGFAKAVLHTVNESASCSRYSDDVTAFLKESEATDARNTAQQFGISSEVVLISEMATSANLRQEALAIQEETIESDMNNNTVDETKSVCPACGGSGKSFGGASCYSCNGTGKSNMNEDDAEEAPEEDTQDDDAKEESDDKGVEILSVKAVTSSDDEGDEEDKDEDGVEIKGVEAVDGDTEESDEESDDDAEESEEDDSANEEDEASETKKCCDKEKDMLLDCDDIKKRKDSFEDKFADLVDAIKRKSDKKKADESMTVSKYPLSAFLNENMFAQFMSMNESQKSNVMTYINESNINPSQMTQELWESAVNYVPEKELWLKYAPANYRTLYESADETTKESIRNTAQYFLFENQRDVNSFWRNTGLQERAERNLLNEQFVNNLPRIETVNESENLGYSMDFIKTVTEMACAYNN